MGKERKQSGGGVEPGLLIQLAAARVAGLPGLNEPGDNGGCAERVAWDN